jgi:HlyD family secretion protein
MNKRKILIISGVVIALLLIWFLFIRKTEKPIVLQTEKPTHGHIAISVTATGRIEPVDTVSVGSQVSGIISKLYVDFNSQVKKGQLLAELDKSLFQAQVDQAAGNVANNKAQLALQTANFGRESLLYKSDAISKAEYDNALATYNSSKASVASAEAQLRSNQKNMSYTSIYSPIDGVVLNRNISVGQTVAASFNTPTLFIIAKDITKMQVQANVDEADIGDVKPGQRVSFSVDAFINDNFKGTVEDIRLHPSVSANVVTYTTIIDAPNNDMKLKPGMTANIIIYTKEVNDAMLIPAKAITFTPDSSLMKDYEIVGKIKKGGRKRMAAGDGAAAGSDAQASNHSVKSRKDTSIVAQTSFVWVLQGKKLVEKRIKTGLNDNTQVEVISGLSDDDVVVTGLPATVAPPTAGNPNGGSGSPFMPPRRRGGGGGRR